MNTQNTQNTQNTPVSRREFTQRVASLGMAAAMTIFTLGSIDLLAGVPATNSLLAQHGTLLASSAASPPRL